MARDLAETLDAIRPYTERRAAVKELALLLARIVPQLAERSTIPVHATGSTFIVDPAAGRVLLLWHPKFGRWLQPGGHCDGDTDVRAVALREAVEETGLASLALRSGPPRPRSGVVRRAEDDADAHRLDDVRAIVRRP